MVFPFENIVGAEYLVCTHWLNIVGAAAGLHPLHPWLLRLCRDVFSWSGEGEAAYLAVVEEGDEAAGESSACNLQVCDEHINWTIYIVILQLQTTFYRIYLLHNLFFDAIVISFLITFILYIQYLYLITYPGLRLPAQLTSKLVLR